MLDGSCVRPSSTQAEHQRRHCRQSSIARSTVGLEAVVTAIANLPSELKVWGRLDRLLLHPEQLFVHVDRQADHQCSDARGSSAGALFRCDAGQLGTQKYREGSVQPDHRGDVNESINSSPLSGTLNAPKPNRFLRRLRIFSGSWQAVLEPDPEIARSGIQ